MAEQGIRIKRVRHAGVNPPAILRSALHADNKADAALRLLTPGKQREYANYVAEAKREETQRRRVEKILPMISDGRGLNDRYRKR